MSDTQTATSDHLRQLRRGFGVLPSLVVLAAIGICVLPALDAGASSPSAAPAATRSITVGDDFFRPRSITVSRGTTLRFAWRRTRHPHNVTRPGQGSKTTRRSGTVVRRTVTRSTTFICTVHPNTMRLRVKVR